MGFLKNAKFTFIGFIEGCAKPIKRGNLLAQKNYFLHNNLSNNTKVSPDNYYLLCRVKRGKKEPQSLVFIRLTNHFK